MPELDQIAAPPTLILADCIQWMAEQPENSIDCIVTSPPYNLGADYRIYGDSRPQQEYLDWLDHVFKELHRILRPDGHFFLNVGYSNRAPWISMDVSNVARRHFSLQNRIVWVKSVTIGEQTHGHFKPINSNRYVTPTNEDVFHFTKGAGTRVAKLAVGVPYQDKINLQNGKRARGRIVKKMGFENYRDFNARASAQEHRAMTQELNERMAKIGSAPDLRCRGSTWFIPYPTIGNRARQRGQHPATFPIELPKMCMNLAGLGANSVVYDPFVGTGSTLVAALQLGLKGIGTDIDGDYLTWARKRLGLAEK